MTDFDRWDPMSEHFNSNTNTYDTGPGAQLPSEHQPANIKLKQMNPLKLHVANISEKMNEQSLLNIFSKYGIVVETFICPFNHYWGYVAFQTSNDAHEALMALNNHPDYKFKVTYFQEKESDNMSVKRQQKNQIETNQRGSSYVNDQHENMLNKNSLPSCSFSTDLFPMNIMNSYRGHPCRSSQESDMGPIPACKNCGVKTLEQCTKCRVYYCTKKCMVLGYKHHLEDCIIIAPHTTDPKYTSTINGKITTPVAAPMMNKSRLNSSDPAMVMEEFQKNLSDYRQYKVQNNENHVNAANINSSYDDDDVDGQRSISMAKTNLNSDMKIQDSNIKQRGKQNRSNKENYDFRINDKSRDENQTRNEILKKQHLFQNKAKYDHRNRGDDNRRQNRTNDYRNDAKVGNERGERNESVSDASSDYENRRYDDSVVGFNSQPKSKENRKPHNESREKANDRYHSSNGNNYENEKKISDEIPEVKSPNKNVSQLKNYSEREYVTSREKFQEGDKLEVRLNEVSIDGCEYSSVRVVKEERLFSILKADMMEETDLPSGIIECKQKCLVCRNDERVRGTIVSAKPLRVRFVDMGWNLHECDPEDVKSCPEEYETVRPFVYKVHFMNTEQKIVEEYKRNNQIFNIIIKNKFNELCWEVEIDSPFNERLVKARQSRETQSRNSDKHTPKVVEKFVLTKDVSVKALVTFIKKDRKHFFIAKLEDMQKIMDLINDKACSELKNIAKDVVCLALLDNLWYRARIINIDPIEVFFLDFGNTAIVERDCVKTAPVEIFNTDPLAIEVQLAEGITEDYEISETHEHFFKPITKDPASELWTVISGEYLDVMVTVILSKNEYYVLQKHDVIKTTEVHKLPRTPLKSEPRLGSVYLCEFDEFGWRVEIVNVSPLTVKYIDYGNEEEINLNQLYELPSNWQKIDPLAFKIVVEPEPSKPLEESQFIHIKAKENNIWTICNPGKTAS